MSVAETYGRVMRIPTSYGRVTGAVNDAVTCPWALESPGRPPAALLASAIPSTTTANTPHSELEPTKPLLASQSNETAYEEPAARLTACVIPIPSCIPGTLTTWPTLNFAAGLALDP